MNQQAENTEKNFLSKISKPSRKGQFLSDTPMERFFWKYRFRIGSRQMSPILTRFINVCIFYLILWILPCCIDVFLYRFLIKFVFSALKLVLIL